MALVFRAQTRYMQMVRTKKNPTKFPSKLTIKSTPTWKKKPKTKPRTIQFLLQKIRMLSVWNTACAERELSSEVALWSQEHLKRCRCSPLWCVWLQGRGRFVVQGGALQSGLIRHIWRRAGSRDFIETLLWRPEVCRSQRNDDFRIWGVSFCHLKRCVSLSRGNITLGFKARKVTGYVFSVSCNWWSDLLRGRINLPLSQKGLAENCLLGFLILFYPKCHVPLLVAEEILVVVESVKSW